MAEEAAIPKQIEFKYIFDHDYNPVFANGIYGGIGPQGDLTMHFFHERTGLPYSQTHDFEREESKLGKLIATTPEKGEAATFVRFITTGVVMNEDCARRLFSWLKGKIDEYDAVSKKASQ